ncbi:hypothetical protein GVN24_24915 [Rhizobium sp. CRIBSB]|nr:hypothetical protein [Rhizobium sp. CRIBSB]
MCRDNLPAGLTIKIPAAPDIYVVAQIVFSGVSFYAIGFEGLVGNSDEFGCIVKSPPIIGAWTNDAEIFKSRWIKSSLQDVYYEDFWDLKYKYMIGNELFTQSFDGKSRFIGGPDDSCLPFKLSVSPIIFGRALCALNGFGEWKSYYDKLRLL